MAMWLRLTAGGALLIGVLLHSLVLLLTEEEIQLPSASEVLRDVPVNPRTAEYADHCQRDLPITEVADGVYLAFSKSFVNVIILDAPEGLIVVDTTEAAETAEDIYRELRQLTKKPIKAIVYTHSHVDHVQGTRAFIDDPNNPPDIWAFHTAIKLTHQKIWFIRRVNFMIAHQFGEALGDARVFARGPHGLGFRPALPPNHLISHDIEHHLIAGLNVTFIHAPGETDDHIAIWVEDKKVLLPGDNIYRSFPNVYSIRGTPARNALQWATSVSKLRSFQAEHLVMQHGSPISGRREIDELLTVYAAGLQYVHDQTVRRMNELRHPDEIARMVRLPPDLASHPYLGEFYGRVDWTSKSVYHGYVGWFSGDPVDLMIVTPMERSRKMVHVIGANRLLDEAETSLMAGDAHWALEFSSHVFRIQPENRRAKDIRMRALKLGSYGTDGGFDIGTRNYFLTTALGMFTDLDIKFDPKSIVDHTPVDALLEVMKISLKEEFTHGVDASIFLHFSDSNKTFHLHVKYSVLTVQKLSTTAGGVYADKDALTVTTTERVWKAIMYQLLPPATAYNYAEITVTPVHRLDDFRLFLSYFLPN